MGAGGDFALRTEEGSEGATSAELRPTSALQIEPAPIIGTPDEIAVDRDLAAGK